MERSEHLLKMSCRYGDFGTFLRNAFISTSERYCLKDIREKLNNFYLFLLRGCRVSTENLEHF